jgi:hypothetical protein
MTEEEFEAKLDRFILFLSKTDPHKSLPSRNMASEVLRESLAKKEKKDEREHGAADDHDHDPSHGDGEVR